MEEHTSRELIDRAIYGRRSGILFYRYLNLTPLFGKGALKNFGSSVLFSPLYRTRQFRRQLQSRAQEI